jgi:hypothetical protein
MRIPGFTAESAVYETRAAGGGWLPHPEAGPDGDRIVPQGLCEIELRPVCRNRCRRSSDPRRCVAQCLDDMCSWDFGGNNPW